MTLFLRTFLRRYHFKVLRFFTRLRFRLLFTYRRVSQK